MPLVPLAEPKTPDALWQEMVDILIEQQDLRTQRICDAFRKWARHLFIHPTGETFQRMTAGSNRAFGIGFGQTMSQPTMVAQTTEWLMPKPGESALDVGLGSGWQAALLQELVGEHGNVAAIERIDGLVTRARERFERLGLQKIQIIHGDGMNPDDVPAGPFDMITCAAGSAAAPEFWKHRLSEGGRLIYPKETAKIESGITMYSDGTSEPAPDGWEDGPLHSLCKTTRNGEELLEEFAPGFCRYVPLLPRTSNATAETALES